MICVIWDGFPQYGARCVGALVRSTREKVVVVARRPTVPIKGMEEFAQCPVKWIADGEQRSLGEICGEWPHLMMVPGWGYPLYNRLRDEARSRGCFIIGASDNNYVFSFKECLRSLRFRLLFKDKYDAFFVPGMSGFRLMRFYGVPANQIVKGLYAADGALFHDGLPLEERPKRMLFVGQLCKRKNVLRLCEAFRRSEGYRRGWTLDLYGSGPLRNQIPQGKGVVVHDFTQPEQLAEIYRQSRCFILPSIGEHWGVVVHEAALSGCVLLLSDCIGAGEDLLENGKNGFYFKPKSINSIASAMSKVYDLADGDLGVAHRESIARGTSIGLDTFVDGICHFDGLIRAVRCC